MIRRWNLARESSLVSKIALRPSLMVLLLKPHRRLRIVRTKTEILLSLCREVNKFSCYLRYLYRSRASDSYSLSNLISELTPFPCRKKKVPFHSVDEPHSFPFLLRALKAGPGRAFHPSMSPISYRHGRYRYRSGRISKIEKE